MKSGLPLPLSFSPLLLGRKSHPLLPLHLSMKLCLLLPLSFLLLFESCSPKATQTGRASFYADKFNGRKTASGETFRNSKKIAAHKTLPFGTKVKVTNLRNGKSVKVRIADRGPFVAGRIIDLSKKAARKIDMDKEGVGNVKIEWKKK